LQPPDRCLEGKRTAATRILRDMLRLLLFRFLPRRILPLLAVWEIVQLVRRLRSGRPLFGDDPTIRNDGISRDDRVIEGHATPVPPRPIESQH
jgi:hypothetical protein